MPALVAGIHVFLGGSLTWMAGTSLDTRPMTIQAVPTAIREVI
jgi:hypothetical protein